MNFLKQILIIFVFPLSLSFCAMPPWIPFKNEAPTPIKEQVKEKAEKKVEKKVTQKEKVTQREVVSTQKSLPKQKDLFAILEPEIKTDNAAIVFSSHLTDRNNRSTSLTGVVKNLKNSSMYMSDVILFKIANEQNIKDVHFTIESFCTNPMSSNETFNSQIEIPFTNSISILQILPEAMLTNIVPWWEKKGNTYIVCSFQFTAKNSNTDIHYFSIPQVYVHGINDHAHLYVVNPNDKYQATDLHPIVYASDTSHHYMKSSSKSIIDQISIVCDHFNHKMDVKDSHTYPLWEWNDVILDHRPTVEEGNIQKCRFIGYSKNKITGFSQPFPLVYPINKSIQITLSQSIKKKALSYRVARDLSKGKDSTYSSFLELKIKNLQGKSVHLWIPALEYVVENILFFKGLKYIFPLNPTMPFPHLPDKLSIGNAGHFIKFKNSASFFLPITTWNIYNPSNYSNTINDRVKINYFLIGGLTIRLSPNASIKIPVSLFIENSCKKNQKPPIAMSFSRPVINIYQSLNSNTKDMVRRTKLKQVHARFLQSGVKPFVHKMTQMDPERFFEVTCKDNGVDKKEFPKHMISKPSHLKINLPKTEETYPYIQKESFSLDEYRERFEADLYTSEMKKIKIGQ